MIIEKSKPSWFRKLVWPIYGKENKKFIPMFVMMASALFTYTCLRMMKDSLVITGPGATSGILPNLKLFFVLPSSIVFIALFMYLNQKLNKQKLFFVTLIPFIVFFLMFSLVLYPNAQYLNASEQWIFSMQAAYPRLTDHIPMIGNWIYTMFYVMSELWGSAVITFLFWGFASYAVSKEERNRFFSGLACYGNVGLIAASSLQYRVCMYCIKNGIKEGTIEYMQVTSYLFYIIIFAIGAFALSYWFLNEYVLPYDNIEVSKEMKAKPKISMSFSESLRLIFSSEYLLYICIVVLAYGISINLVEVTWKGVIKEVYKNKISIDLFNASVYYYVGLFTLSLGFLMKGCIEGLGWKKTALITPIILILTSSLFFIFIIFGDSIPRSLLLGYSSLQAAAYLGAVQNIMSKATKYVLFDPTTQLAYVPLDEKVRLNGKAAVDVIGGRAGKSFGSAIQSALGFLLKGGKGIVIAPYLFPITLILGVGWLFATLRLSDLYEAALKTKNKKDELDSLSSIQKNKENSDSWEDFNDQEEVKGEEKDVK